MPRTVSSPVRWIGTPSTSSEAKAVALGVRPLDAAVLDANRRPALRQLLGQLGVDVERRRPAVELLVQALQGRRIDRRLRLARIPGSTESGPRSSCGSACLRTVACRSASHAPLSGAGIGLLLADGAGLDQGLGVHLAHRWVLLDRGIHGGLGRPGRRPRCGHSAGSRPGRSPRRRGNAGVHHRQPGGGRGCLRVVRVDVDDRCVEALGKVAGIGG